MAKYANYVERKPFSRVKLAYFRHNIFTKFHFTILGIISWRETDLRVRVLKNFHFAVPGISNAVSFRTGQVLFSLWTTAREYNTGTFLPSMLFLALTTQTPPPHVGLAFVSVWLQRTPRMKHAHKVHTCQLWTGYQCIVNRRPPEHGSPAWCDTQGPTCQVWRGTGRPQE